MLYHTIAEHEEKILQATNQLNIVMPSTDTHAIANATEAIERNVRECTDAVNKMPDQKALDAAVKESEAKILEIRQVKAEAISQAISELATYVGGKVNFLAGDKQMVQYVNAYTNEPEKKAEVISQFLVESIDAAKIEIKQDKDKKYEVDSNKAKNIQKVVAAALKAAGHDEKYVEKAAKRLYLNALADSGIGLTRWERVKKCAMEVKDTIKEKIGLKFDSKTIADSYKRKLEDKQPQQISAQPAAKRAKTEPGISTI